MDELKRRRRSLCLKDGDREAGRKRKTPDAAPVFAHNEGGDYMQPLKSVSAERLLTPFDLFFSP